MKLHGSAALSQRQRRRLVALVGSGMTIAAAAAIVGCSGQTGSKWVNRDRRGEGLEDRSSRPHRSPRRASAAVEQAVLRARAELQAGPQVIGWATGIASSTVQAILRRHGCSKLKPPVPREAIVHYERERPGELVHVDVKKLGRIVPSRSPSHGRSLQASARTRGLAVPVRRDRRRDPARVRPSLPRRNCRLGARLPHRLRLLLRRHGIRLERVLTDNGTCFKRRWHDACDELEIGVRKTRPYRPQTNGKAERPIRTLLERWAYAYSYPTEAERAQALPDALDSYNRYRPHPALAGQTPLQRVNDLSGTNT